MRTDLTLMEVKRLADNLIAQYPDDAELLTDMLEGCTDLHELCSRLNAKRLDADDMVKSLTARISDNQARKKRFEVRSKSYRATLVELLEAAQQKKVELPEATISLSVKKPKRVVLDESLVPDSYCKFTTTRKPDLAAIKAATKHVNGTQMDNGGVSLTVRVK